MSESATSPADTQPEANPSPNVPKIAPAPGYLNPKVPPCPPPSYCENLSLEQTQIVEPEEEDDEAENFCAPEDRPLTGTTLAKGKHHCNANPVQRRSFFLLQWIKRFQRRLCNYEDPGNTPTICLLAALTALFAYTIVWAISYVFYFFSSLLHSSFTPCLRKQVREAKTEIRKSLKELGWIPHVVLSQVALLTYGFLLALASVAEILSTSLGYVWDVAYAAVTGSVPKSLKTAMVPEKMVTHKKQIKHPLLPFPSGYSNDVVFPIFGKALVIDPTGQRNYSWTVEPPKNPCPGDKPELSLKSLLKIKSTCSSEFGGMDLADLALKLRPGGAATITGQLLTELIWGPSEPPASPEGDRKWVSPISCQQRTDSSSSTDDPDDPCATLFTSSPPPPPPPEDQPEPETEVPPPPPPENTRKKCNCIFGMKLNSLNETAHSFISGQTGTKVGIRRVENRLLPDIGVDFRIRKMLHRVINPVVLPVGSGLNQFRLFDSVSGWADFFGLGDQRRLRFVDPVASDIWMKHLTAASPSTSELIIPLDSKLKPVCEELAQKLAKEKANLLADPESPAKIQITDEPDDLQLLRLDFTLTKTFSINSVAILEGLENLREKSARHLLFQLASQDLGDGSQLLVFTADPAKMKLSERKAGKLVEEPCFTEPDGVRNYLNKVWKQTLTLSTRNKLIESLTRSVTLVGQERCSDQESFPGKFFSAAA
ncbi:unnamed protein product [Notodromas monacha]|uniref:Uncharacterized protein n=1 Tax=Notodromas monacha TaxID=399045 RepID=A0A7R9BXH0_9CRUS|nr:unnamed protein product [Notodromas monacha]CAG0922437.1 unnamed protein product [Notodromas monacha]